ncbi:MAG: hypothetical protein ACR2QR_03285, partial [Woeseiaceae bacterium]
QILNGNRMNLRTCRYLVTAILLSHGVVSTASAQVNEDDWEYSLTPYIWLPTIDGTLKYNLPPGAGGSPNISVGPTDWLELLNAGLLVNGNARKGRFSIFTDLVYLSLTSKNDGRVESVDDGGSRIPVDASLVLNTRSDLDGLTITLAGGYALRQTESTVVDIFAGVRFFGVDVTTSWDLTASITAPGGGLVLPAQGSIGRDTDLWDGIVGVRGRQAIGDGNWSMPFYLDVGTGSSELTWNAMAGFSYEFGWGDLMLMYRHLEYDQDAASLLQDFSFSGPAFGARFHF